MTKRTYIDSNILIAAFQSDKETAKRAFAILDDTQRQFITSNFVRLETLPKPKFHRFLEEVQFIQDFFEHCTEQVKINSQLVEYAEVLATKYDLTPMDALHASAAIRANVDEFVTLEKPTKPFCRITEIKIVSIYHWMRKKTHENIL